MSCIAINCSSVIPPPLQPNPDVAGTGVIVGFVATAYLTLLLLLIFYLLGFHEAWSKNANKSNQIDSIVFEKFSKWFLFSKTPSYKWGGPVRAMIMVLSDQQIVTGLAILIAGYAQLSCSIDAYHWQIMASLAWFSSVTHLTTLTLLQDYLKQRPALRILRVIFMLAIVTMLTSAQSITSVDAWPVIYDSLYQGLPAACFFRHLWSGHFSYLSMGVLIPVGFLWINLIFRIVRLFDWSSRKAAALMKDWPLSLMERILERMKRTFTVPPGTTFHIGWMLQTSHGSSAAKQNSLHIVSFRTLWLYFKFSIYCGFLSFYVISNATYEISETMLYEVFWLLVAVLWGTMGLFNTRKSIELYNNPPSWAQADFGKFPPYDGLEENGWAFGQIISVLLLAVPLLTMAEGLSDVYAMPSNSQAISLSTTNNTQHVIQYQPEGNWSYHQARTMSYTRNWYIRAWYRKLIFMFLSIAFLAGAIALYVQYKSLGSALVNMFLRGYFWAACMPILLFLYVFVCVVMEDFFLLPHKSATFAWITWIMYVLVLLTGVSFWILMAITF